MVHRWPIARITRSSFIACRWQVDHGISIEEAGRHQLESAARDWRRERVLFGSETKPSSAVATPPFSTDARMSEAAEAWEKIREKGYIIDLEQFATRSSLPSHPGHPQ